MPQIDQIGNWLVYLNGIEVPAESAQVSTGAFSPAQANISFAPDVELIRLGNEDRVQVAIFYLDEAHAKATGTQPQFCLLFEGEITSWAYENTPLGRRINFTAFSHAHIFAQLHTFFLTNVQDIAAGTIDAPRPEAGETALAPPIASSVFPTALFITGLSQQGDLIKRPYDFIENIFKGLFSNEGVAAIFRSAPAAFFFSKWSRLTNFVNHWVPSPYIESRDLEDGIFPILRAAGGAAAVGSLIGLSTRLGSSNDFWTFLTELFRHVAYEFTCIPNMPLCTYDLTKGVIDGPPEFSDTNEAVQQAAAQLKEATQVYNTLLYTAANAGLSSQEIEDLVAAAKDKRDGYKEIYNTKLAEFTVNQGPGKGSKDPNRPVRLLSYVTKPPLHFCVPPRCNILLPSMITAYQLDENYFDAPTRIYVTNRLNTATTGGQLYSERATTNGYPPRVDTELRNKDKQWTRSGYNFLLFPEEFFKGPVVTRRDSPDWLVMLAKDGIEDKIYKLYAENEYHRTRADTKSAAVSLRFNPYLVPGFPTVVFDNKNTGVHCFAYVLNVTHYLSANSMTTSAGLSTVQVMEDFFEEYINQVSGINGRLPLAKLEESQAVKDAKAALDAAQKKYDDAFSVADYLTAYTLSKDVKAAELAYNLAIQSSREIIMVPPHPIDEIRDRFQDWKPANEYYATLFYQGQTDATFGAAFDWRTSIGVVDVNDPVTDPERIFVNPVKELTKQDSEGNTYTAYEVSTNAIENNGAVTYGLTGSLKQIAEDTDASMQHVARPICTLDEYIDFQGSRGIREGKVSPASTSGERPLGAKAAAYYTKILNMSYLTVPEPEEDADGNRKETVKEDSRKDWQTRLMNYRAKIYSLRFYRA